LWDCFAESKRPGGAPANVAFHISQLGGRGIICSRVGVDNAGDKLRSHLRDHDMDDSFVQRDPDHPTGTVTVTTDESGSPDYIIHENVAWDFLELTDDMRELVARADALCFGTLAQRNGVSRETIHACLKAAGGARIVYDVNLRQNWYHRDWVERSLHAAHIVKLNIDEVAILSDLLGAPRPPTAFADHIRRHYDVSTLCVTRGAEGCMVAGPDGTADVTGSRVEVVDTVGAGDAFTAGLICAHLWGWGSHQTARLANAVGGLVAGRAGAMPSLTAEIAELIERIKRFTPTHSDARG